MQAPEPTFSPRTSPPKAPGGPRLAAALTGSVSAPGRASRRPGARTQPHRLNPSTRWARDGEALGGPLGSLLRVSSYGSEAFGVGGRPHNFRRAAAEPREDEGAEENLQVCLKVQHFMVTGWPGKPNTPGMLYNCEASPGARHISALQRHFCWENPRRNTPGCYPRAPKCSGAVVPGEGNMSGLGLNRCSLPCG